MKRVFLMVALGLAACAPVSAPVPGAKMPASSAAASSMRFERGWPLDPTGRITKKQFGTYVTPEHSPVQPEKFRGYHTGVDLELLPGESAHDVVIVAVCDGPLVQARRVGGYGGVAVQRCSEGTEAVTVLYGHLSVESIEPKTGTILSAGDRIGVLGEGFTDETDGERAHLHVAIHKGDAVEWRGYVQSESGLDDWIDPASFIGR